MSSAVDVKPIKKTVDLGDGVEREVVFSLNAMAELEEKYGSVEEAFTKVQNGSVAAIRFLLWCVLVPDGETDLTEREIGKLIKLDNLNDIMDMLMDTLQAQMPDTVSADPNVNNPALTNNPALPSDW